MVILYFLARLKIGAHLSPSPSSHLRAYLITSARDGQDRPAWWRERKKAQPLHRAEEVWPPGLCAAPSFGGEIAQSSRRGAPCEHVEHLQVGEGWSWGGGTDRPDTIELRQTASSNRVVVPILRELCWEMRIESGLAWRREGELTPMGQHSS